VRLLGWLHAVPDEPSYRPRSNAKPDRRTRLQRLQEDGVDPVMPDIDDSVEHLVRYLFEVGPVEPRGADLSPISFGELRQWQASYGICLRPWEQRALRDLSREYLQEHRAASDPARPAPVVVLNDAVRENVAKAMRMQLRAIKAAAEEKANRKQERRKRKR